MQAFPSAKVLLNLRDPDAWYGSLISLASTLQAFRPLATQSTRLHSRVASRFAGYTSPALQFPKNADVTLRNTYPCNKK